MNMKKCILKYLCKKCITRIEDVEELLEWVGFDSYMKRNKDRIEELETQIANLQHQEETSSTEAKPKKRKYYRKPKTEVVPVKK